MLKSVRVLHRVNPGQEQSWGRCRGTSNPPAKSCCILAQESVYTSSFYTPRAGRGTARPLGISFPKEELHMFCHHGSCKFGPCPMASAALAPGPLPGLHAALRSSSWSMGLVKFPIKESFSFLPVAPSPKMGLSVWPQCQTTSLSCPVPHAQEILFCSLNQKESAVVIQSGLHNLVHLAAQH